MYFTSSNLMTSKIFLFLFAMPLAIYAQDDLMDLLDAEDETSSSQLVFGTFKGTRIINGHSVETRGAGELDFLISHRFGPLDSGPERFWGLDGANIRLGLSYGITDKLTVGIGRSSFNQVYDILGKYRVVEQSDRIPVSTTLFVSGARRTDEFFRDDVGPDFQSSNRNGYVIQALIARKLNSDLSLQFSPTYVLRDYSEYPDEAESLFVLGFAGRYLITRRLSINGEYFARVEGSADAEDAFAIGVDIETGGHIFQLHLTNAQQIVERGFLLETEGNFFKGDIHFGFNISRVFDLTPGR